MRRLFVSAFLALAVTLTAAFPARAQQGGVPVQPLWYCQLSATNLSSAVKLTSCTAGSFTGTGSGTTMTATSPAGIILPGMTLTGTGVPTGTTVVSQLTGSGGCVPGTSGCAAGGAGTYQTSQATTSNSASVTAGGIPPNANMAVMQAEVADVRFRDDGGVPTTSVGAYIVGTSSETATDRITYMGNLSALQFIAQSGSPLLDVTFYRIPQ